jgi:hypothetical protein
MGLREGLIRGTPPLILNLGTRWRRVVNFTPRPLYLRKRIPVPIRWATEPVWIFGEDRNLLPLRAFELRIIQPTDYTLQLIC